MSWTHFLSYKPFFCILLSGSEAVVGSELCLHHKNSWLCVRHLVARSSPKSGNTGNHRGYENAAWISGGIFIALLMRSEFHFTD